MKRWNTKDKRSWIGLLVLVLLALGVFLYFKPGAGPSKAPTLEEISKAQNTNQYEKAVKLIEEALKSATSKSEKATLYIKLGNTYLDAGNNNGKAIEAYKKAAEANGMTHTIALQLSEAYRADGDSTQAINYLETAISLWPKNDPLYSAEVRDMQKRIEFLQKGSTDR